jgi:hypothetical protein
MSARAVRSALVSFTVVASIIVMGCGKKSSTAPLSTGAATTTTVAAGPAPTTAATAGGSTSDAALNQQIQGLTQSLNQVSTDLSNADKAAANGG